MAILSYQYLQSNFILIPEEEELNGEANAELKENLSPVVDTARPVEHDVLSDEIKHFQLRLVIRDDSLALGHLAELSINL
jgi:hypothetical protein